MEPISVPINHSKEEEAMKPITEKSVTEGEQKLEWGTTAMTEYLFAPFVQPSGDKRKQCSDSSSDDDSEGDEEEKKNEAKWLRTHRAKRSSQKECYDPQLEVYKNTLLKEIEVKEKKLIMIIWGKKRKQRIFVPQLKRELNVLNKMYQKLFK
ncbi:unnamed protein product [Nezara viridula]|uniref:Uncharacterized protein n=1 Tax=Nezara viridula TaxID=85310 RepID=A0A9P0HQ98_NEZVI|nr:unnamed protein product [Nezara viridula]